MIRLLLVEDEDDTRNGLVEFIPWKLLGIDEVVTAENGEEALNTAIKSKPDIILTDVRMPRMDGIQLSARLRTLFPDCIIIFLSGYSDKEYLKSAISVKALNYVEKPVDINEINEVIREAVGQCLKAYEKTGLVKQNLALELISAKDEASLAKCLVTADVNFPKDGRYVTILGKLDETGLKDNPAFTGSTVIKLLQEAIKEICSGYLSAVKNESYIITHLACNAAFNKGRLKSSLQEVFDLLAAEYSCTPPVFFSIGEIVTGPCRIRESYQTAVIAAQKFFFTGYGKIVFYTESRSGITVFDTKAVERFGSLLMEDKKTEASAFIDMLCSTVKCDGNTLVNQIKNMFFLMSLKMEKVADERNINDFKTSGSSEEFLWEQFNSLTTLESVKAYLHGRIEAFFSCLDGKSDKSKLVREVISYIEKYYHDEKISVNDISQKIHLTPSYLCLVFKNETGKTVNQYLTEYRINKAKELLKNRHIKLLEIAGDVGYLDANYFTRLFKKTVGLTPSEYREKYLL